MIGAHLLAHAGEGRVLPPLTPLGLLSDWTLEWVPALGAVLVGALYVYAVRRLRARGDAWPVTRTLMFLGLGLGTFVVATQSALATYDTTLLWVHMVQHMVLGMITPVFLALGAPVTLALRTLPRRSRGWLLAGLHSQLARVLTFPVLTGALFVATPVALYFTGWYSATLRNPWLHELNHVHFVVVGCLWFWPLLSPDPVPGRLTYPLRLLAVFVTMPFHAFMGVAIMGSSTLLGGDWYADLGRSWGPSLARDQQIAGGVLWGSGDLVGLIVLGALFVRWFSASQREAVREDRRLDRLEAAGERAAQSGR